MMPRFPSYGSWDTFSFSKEVSSYRDWGALCFLGGGLVIRQRQRRILQGIWKWGITAYKPGVVGRV